MTSICATWRTISAASTCKPPSSLGAQPTARRIVLVDLYWTRDKDPRVPLGHASLLATLRSAPELDIRSIVIAVNAGHSCEAIAAIILAETDNLPASSIDIAIGAYIWNERYLQRLLPLLRLGGFQGRLILGGPQVSYSESGLEALYPDANLFIRGHAETALLAVVRTDQPVQIAGVHYAGTPDTGTQARTVIEDLPSPWLTKQIPLESQTFLRWETQRGCQFKCAFCQHRQPDATLKGVTLPQARVFDEIDYICRAGVKDVAVLDPVFNSNQHPGHAVRVLRRFAENGYTGRLSLQCRAELVDAPFLDAAQALDVCLEFGLQTIHPNEQQAIGRPNQMDRVHAVLARVRERRIRHEVSLIFGLPTQTLDSFTASVRWCLERDVPVIKAFPLLLLRGTKLDTERSRWNLIVEDDMMPQVVESNSFCRSEWEAMQRISEVLRHTERRHPAMDDLLKCAQIVQPDRTRWQPRAVQKGA